LGIFFFRSINYGYKTGQLSITQNQADDPVITNEDFFSENCKFWQLRDRPFNLKGGGYGFLFRSEIFFRTTHELEYFFLCRAKTEFLFPEINIRLYYKNFESDYFFFPPPKLEYFFQQHWESEYFFRKTFTWDI
jgi:hypothetical protein